jgi:hypothetical protein
MGVKISNLPIVAVPALTDVFPIVQAGVTYKESGTQLSSLFATAGANSNITSLTGITGVIQGPTFINDINGNHEIGFTATASAVNYLSIVNAATGAAVKLEAAGTDTNINMSIFAKGSGGVGIVGNNAGLLNPVAFYNGTANQHQTQFYFANTANTRAVTFPDFDGTVYLSSKANGVEAANAVTANGTSGVITTSALTTAAGASYAITWTNTFIASASIILLSLMGGTNTKNTLQLKATAGSGTSTLTLTNNNAAALDGTVIIGYIVIP